MLVLWDVDGTLVHTGGQGRAAFMDAFEVVLGHAPEVEDLPMAGRTDHAISLELLRANGVPEPEGLLPRMLGALRTCLSRRSELIASRGRPLPGVREALTGIGALDGVTQSLLTGNIEPNARTKLAAFGLETLVELDIGGYGSDPGARSELVGVAWRKALAKHGPQIEAGEVALVGDTPFDVEAARAAGARAVSVATGPYSAEQLERSRPDAVLVDLSDLDAVMRALAPDRSTR